MSRETQNRTGPYKRLSCTTRKYPLFPSIHENEFVTAFIKEAKLFNSFFAKQCSFLK